MKSTHTAPTRRIFNPLTSVSSSEKAMVSQSSLINTDIGICPKCKKEMSRATIAGGAPVFYCEADRVAHPLPNELLF